MFELSFLGASKIWNRPTWANLFFTPDYEQVFPSSGENNLQGIQQHHLRPSESSGGKKRNRGSTTESLTWDGRLINVITFFKNIYISTEKGIFPWKLPFSQSDENIGKHQLNPKQSYDGKQPLNFKESFFQLFKFKTGLGEATAHNHNTGNQVHEKESLSFP